MPEYIFLFTKTQAFAGFLRVMAISSTIENVNGEKYANSPLTVPPLPEQTAIVRFLDHANRRIRRYIRAKKKLIALLEEQRQAIIHQAVTGQIDVRTGQPYPAYKPSQEIRVAERRAGALGADHRFALLLTPQVRYDGQQHSRATIGVLRPRRYSVFV